MMRGTRDQAATQLHRQAVNVSARNVLGRDDRRNRPWLSRPGNQPPPCLLLSPTDVRRDYLVPAGGHSFCEFKGMAQYWSFEVNGVLAETAAWSYPNPTNAFLALKDYLAFYASRVDGCWVGDEQVEAQAGDFYGGWISSRVVGPFKGPPGTRGW